VERGCDRDRNGQNAGVEAAREGLEGVCITAG
jgi:hypothetical protein